MYTSYKLPFTNANLNILPVPAWKRPRNSISNKDISHLSISVKVPLNSFIRKKKEKLARAYLEIIVSIKAFGANGT